MLRVSRLANIPCAEWHEATPAGSTCIPALDTYLASVNARRTSQEWPLNRGDVIEIQGPAASGKTQLTYHMIVTCLLPQKFRDVDLGGWGEAVVFIDTDSKFNIRRLHELLVSRLRRFLGEDIASDTAVPLEELATQLLRNLHVFRPTSSAQLAITLLHLPRYHASEPRLQNKEIGLLAIDSMSAFYWRDRYTLEQLRDAVDNSSRGNLPPNPLLHVLKALAKFRSLYRPVILMTNWGLNPLEKPSTSGEPVSPFYRQHLHPFPAPFEPHGAAEAVFNIEASQSLGVPGAPQPVRAGSRTPQRSGSTLPLHYHITLHPSPIDPFPASFTLTDALHHEDVRSVLVKKGEIKGLIRTPGENVVGEFTFRIGEREVLVDPDGQP
ncbi:P-loop containing nucleoside triphosphate hydrolase protein [Trametes meyenii]|nr:P-loop containing nucleoside triphosphate hydrolase protein [Trametes meyenii]